MAARNSGQRLDGMAALSREMKEIFISFNKKLDLLFQMQEEALMKKMVHKSVSVTKAGLAGGGNESDLNGIAEDEPNLVDDEEIKTSLSDSDEVGPELLGDEEITPDLTSTNGFKVELTPSILAEEVVSETRGFEAGKNNQLGAIMSHGQLVDRIGTILTEGRAATSPSPISTKKKKKKKEKEKEKETTVGKNRGKSATLKRRRQWRMGGEPRRDQNLSNGRSSASASEKKKTEEAAVVKDCGKPCVAVQVGGRRGSVMAAKYHGSSKKQGCGCEEAWSRRVAMRRQQWSGPEVRGQRGKAEDREKGEDWDEERRRQGAGSSKVARSGHPRQRWSSGIRSTW